MQVITNQVRIDRGARVAKIGIVVGLGFLAGGLIFSLAVKDPSLLWVPLVLLVVGIGFSGVGANNMTRWVRPPRADQALEQALKGLDDRYRLYNYTLPAPHVLLGPLGVTVLTALGHDGVIRYEGGKFQRKPSLARALRFMAEEGLGKPLAVADDQVRALEQWLAKSGGAERLEIQSVVVFYNPRVELTVTDPPRPVVVPKGLKRALRRQTEGEVPAAQIRALQERFEGRG